jgi:hypothetical protein
MGHSIGDGIIVVALAAALIGYLYFKHRERQRRLELIHQERLVAIEKGVPLPEIPVDPMPMPQKASFDEQGFPVFPGIMLTTFGFGAMVALLLLPADNDAQPFWPMPMPFLLMGLGMLLYSYLTARRER